MFLTDALIPCLFVFGIATLFALCVNLIGRLQVVFSKVPKWLSTNPIDFQYHLHLHAKAIVEGTGFSEELCFTKWSVSSNTEIIWQSIHYT